MMTIKPKKTVRNISNKAVPIKGAKTLDTEKVVNTLAVRKDVTGETFAGICL